MAGDLNLCRFSIGCRFLARIFGQKREGGGVVLGPDDGGGGGGRPGASASAPVYHLCSYSRGELSR